MKIHVAIFLFSMVMLRYATIANSRSEVTVSGMTDISIPTEIKHVWELGKNSIDPKSVKGKIEVANGTVKIDGIRLYSLPVTLHDDLIMDILPGDSVLIQLEIPIESALHASSAAKKMDAMDILNPPPAADLFNYDLSYIDFITPNETESRICHLLFAGKCHF